MSHWARLTSIITAAAFVWVAVGAPVVDAVWFHVGPVHADRPHVEDAGDPACHAERCTLGAPGAPVAPMRGALDVPRTQLLPMASRIPFPEDLQFDHPSPPAPGSRAPPA